MNNEQILMCVVALVLGMLLANMLKNVCGCKVVEGYDTCYSDTCHNTRDAAHWRDGRCWLNGPDYNTCVMGGGGCTCAGASD